MNFSDIKTIDVLGKEWYDRKCGNSYNSVRITLNYGMSDRRDIHLPMTYGYGDSYLYRATQWLAKEFNVEHEPIWCLKEKGIIIRYRKEENCRKREVELFGNEVKFV